MCVWQNHKCTYRKYWRAELLLCIIMRVVNIYMYSFVPTCLPYKIHDFPFSAASVKSPFCDWGLDLKAAGWASGTSTLFQYFQWIAWKNHLALPDTAWRRMAGKGHMVLSLLPLPRVTRLELENWNAKCWFFPIWYAAGYAMLDAAGLATHTCHCSHHRAVADGRPGLSALSHDSYCFLSWRVKQGSWPPPPPAPGNGPFHPSLRGKVPWTIPGGKKRAWNLLNRVMIILHKSFHLG